LTGAHIISVSKDIIISIAAIVGSVIAIKGLITWKRKIKWKTEYGLARRFLVSLYKYRDAVNGVRHPVMMAYEMPYPPEDKIQKAAQLFQLIRS
jgi:hypothetical protein